MTTTRDITIRQAARGTVGWEWRFTVEVPGNSVVMVRETIEAARKLAALQAGIHGLAVREELA